MCDFIRGAPNNANISEMFVFCRGVFVRVLLDFIVNKHRFSSKVCEASARYTADSVGISSLRSLDLARPSGALGNVS